MNSELKERLRKAHHALARSDFEILEYHERAQKPGFPSGAAVLAEASQEINNRGEITRALLEDLNVEYREEIDKAKHGEENCAAELADEIQVLEHATHEVRGADLQKLRTQIREGYATLQLQRELQASAGEFDGSYKRNPIGDWND